jgi:hypothetical protein
VAQKWSKMAGKNIFDLYVFLVAKWLLFLNLNQDASLAFCLWLDCCLVLSRYLLTQENRKTDKGFSTSTLPRHTHTLYVLLFPFSLHFCIKEGGE